MNWWETAFSKTYSDVFHRLFPEPTQQEVERISAWFPLVSYPNVLDLACGEGRHTLELTKQGYRVTGVDVSDDFLEIAKSRAVHLEQPPTFLHQDIRTLQLPQPVELVLLIGNAFGYGTDQDQQSILDRVSEHLLPDGSFLLVMPNGLRSMCAFHEEETIEKIFQLDQQEVVLKEHYTFHAQTCVKSSVWSVVKQGETVYEQIAHVRYYTVPEVIQMLDRSHLVVDRIFGGYDEQPYHKMSPSIVFIAKKKK